MLCVSVWGEGCGERTQWCLGVSCPGAVDIEGAGRA